MHHLRLRFLVCCYLVLLAASAFADTNPLLKTVSASFKNIEALQFSELAALQAGNTEQAARKLNQPAVITVRGIHGLGAFRIFLTSIRHFNITQVNVASDSADQNQLESIAPALHLRGYAEKGGKQLGKVIATLQGSRLEISPLFLNQRRDRAFSLELDLREAASTSTVKARYMRKRRATRLLAEFSRGHTSDSIDLGLSMYRLPILNNQRAYFGGTTHSSTVRTLEIVQEADKRLWQKLDRSSGRVVAEMSRILAAGEMVYEDELGIRFDVVGTNLHLKNNKKPYRANQPGTLLAQMSRLANSHNGDVTVLFTGRDIGSDNQRNGLPGIAGVAVLDATCSPLRERAVSAFEYLGSRALTSLQTVILIHELAHTLGARHPNDLNFGLCQNAACCSSVVSSSAAARICSLSANNSVFANCSKSCVCRDASGARCPEDADERSAMDAAVSIGVTKASFSTTSRNEIMNHVTAMGACLERADVRQAGGATSQADVTLSIALAKRTGTTTFTIDYNQERNNCSAALFLSKRKDLAELDRNSSEFQSNVQQVNFSSDGLSDQFRSKLRRRARGALYAFVELACGESHLRSSVVRQKGYKGIESKNSSVLSMTQYLARITARMRRLA